MAAVKNVKVILGKTIKGVIVKKNTDTSDRLRMIFYLVFSDDTSYEIYSEADISFTRGLSGGGMADARAYVTGKDQPIVNIFDESLDDH